MMNVANAILLETLYQKVLGRNRVRNLFPVPLTRLEFLRSVHELLHQL